MTIALISDPTKLTRQDIDNRPFVCTCQNCKTSFQDEECLRYEDQSGMKLCENCFDEIKNQQP